VQISGNILLRKEKKVKTGPFCTKQPHFVHRYFGFYFSTFYEYIITIIQNYLYSSLTTSIKCEVISITMTQT